MAATIQDITNPDLSYEERARLRKERRGKKATSVVRSSTVMQKYNGKKLYFFNIEHKFVSYIQAS